MTQENTKGQVNVASNSLIKRLCEQIDSTGSFSEIVIVVGHKKENLINHVNEFTGHLNITFVSNDIYDKTNNIYSLYLVKERLISSDCVIFESDLILKDGIINRFVSSSAENTVMLARYESWMDGTVVELAEDYKIVKFIPGNSLDYLLKHRYFKTVNVYKFSHEFSKKHYVPFLEAYINSFGANSYYEEVLKVISFLEHTNLIGHVLTDEEFWYEIDDQHDLLNAESIFATGENKYDQIMSRYGGYWRFPSLVDFCYLVNPYYPNKRLVQELQASFDSLLREYPSGHGVQRLMAARNFGVSKENVVVGNGGTELITSFAKSLKLKGARKRVGIILPTFEEYWRQFDNEGFQIIPYHTKNPFEYTLDELLPFLDNIDILILINPDNPSGNTLGSDDVFELIEKAADSNVDILVDESFMDFADEVNYFTLIDDNLLSTHKNLFVLKSISKSYGVPGLRLGVLFSSNEVVLNKVMNNLSIWNINSFAEKYLDISFKYRKIYSDSRLLIADSRNTLLEMLSKVKFLRPFPSQANYLLCEVDTNYINSRELVVKLLDDHNLLIKDCSTKRGFEGQSFVRIAVRSEKDNKKLMRALLDIQVEVVMR